MLVAVYRTMMTLSDSLSAVARAAMALVGFVETSPDLVMPSLPVGRRRCSSLRSSPYQTDDPGRPVDLLDGIAKRERSDRPGESSLSCRQPTPSTHASEAEAANEDAGRVRRRSGAIEYPHQPAAGRALEASVCEQWARPEAAPENQEQRGEKGY
jgi:hypothetical protein